MEDPLSREFYTEMCRLNRNKRVFRRAALALHAIASQHPFVDGNKRTALIVAENILGQNGLFLAVDEGQVVEFMLGARVLSVRTGRN